MNLICMLPQCVVLISVAIYEETFVKQMNSRRDLNNLWCQARTGIRVNYSLGALPEEAVHVKMLWSGRAR